MAIRTVSSYCSLLDQLDVERGSYFYGGANSFWNDGAVAAVIYGEAHIVSSDLDDADRFANVFGRLRVETSEVRDNAGVLAVDITIGVYPGAYVEVRNGANIQGESYDLYVKDHTPSPSISYPAVGSHIFENNLGVWRAS